MHFPIKPLAGIFITLCLILEIRKGYFQKWRDYLQSIDFRPYLRILAFTTLTFGGLLAFDTPWLEWVRGYKSTVTAAISEYGGILGKGTNPWFFMGSVYCLAVLLKRERWARFSFACIFSSLITSVAANILKISFLRARPLMNKGNLSFFNLEGVLHLKKDNFFSFPSGDVAVVAGAAAYLFYKIRNFYFRSLFLVLPLMTAFSRVYKNKHWPSDTLFSIGLGLAAALFVIHYERFMKPSVEAR